MASVQDLESRLGIVERKLDFLMRVGSVTKRTPSELMPGEWIEEQLTLLDLYREIQAAGGTLEKVSDGNV